VLTFSGGADVVAERIWGKPLLVVGSWGAAICTGFYCLRHSAATIELVYIYTCVYINKDYMRVYTERERERDACACSYFLELRHSAATIELVNIYACIYINKDMYVYT